MHQQSQSDLTTKNFIEACCLCHQVCLHTAMNHCIETGGKHIKAKHLRVMLNCAEICQTSANFQLTGSHFLNRLYELCAEICEACAAECDEIGHMDHCVEACQACADSCRQMLSTQH